MSGLILEKSVVGQVVPSGAGKDVNGYLCEDLKRKSVSEGSEDRHQSYHGLHFTAPPIVSLSPSLMH